MRPHPTGRLCMPARFGRQSVVRRDDLMSSLSPPTHSAGALDRARQSRLFSPYAAGATIDIVSTRTPMPIVDDTATLRR